ncbi:MAG TPA: CHAD domain-containing protein [Terriglobia bacterium]|nr:CHAD domain-containing protein [Terriglobia bacterium]
MAKPSHGRAHSGATTGVPADSGAGEVARQSPTSTFEELNAPEVSRRVVKLALKQLDRLVALESKVLRDASIEPAHNLRVASRRLQGLVDFLYPAPAPGNIRKLRRRLKKVRAALGELRNQDVITWRIERALARKRIARRAAWEAAQEYAGKLRPKVAQRAHRKLTRLNLSELYVRLRKELENRLPEEPADATRVIVFPEERAPAGPIPAPEAAPEAVGANGSGPAGRFSERLDELWKDFVAKAAEAHENISSLHSLRIAAKRLRYLVEVAAELEVTGSHEALACLRALQGRLGDWHDYQVLGGTLLAMVARRQFLEENLPLAIQVEQLVLALRSSKTRSCQRYLRQTLRSPEYRRLAEWIGQWTARRPLSTA